MPRQTVIISPDRATAGELESLLLQQFPDAPPLLVSQYPSPRETATQLGAVDAPLVLLDVASDAAQALGLLSELSLSGSIQVFAILSNDDPDVILRCLRAGAADFLIRPFTRDQLEAALGKLARQQPSSEDGQGREPCKVIAVMPAKGACGATTVACNLAYCWKRLGAKRVLLADLDPLTGTMSFLLKTKSVHSFVDVLQRSHELDADLWRAMVSNVNGVDVLFAPELVTENSGEFNDPSPILQYARHAYDIVVIDAGSVYGDWNLAQARAANELLLVTTNELPALQAAQRALSYLESSRIGSWKIRLLVNRYHRDVGLSREVIGTALRTEVYDSLPSDYDAVQKALMEGRAVPSGTTYGKSLMKLAERLGGPIEREVETKKPSAFSGLLGLFSRDSK